MHTLNHTLEKSLLDADGRYMSPQELYPVEQYIQSFAARVEAYHFLRDNSDKLVLAALRKLAQIHPDVIQKHGQRCKYDMTEVLRYIALAILRDDEVFFKEQMLVWLDTILVAHKKTEQCAMAYRYLQDAVNQSLTSAHSGLVRSYLDTVILALESHA
ncbi:phycocyanin [Geitlerinema sp. PCC 7407]|uniref:phycocyanin n=1 Tax=Geitlerinema sp. PCC 7407 TaxID=1173025 RepID=UPI00029F9E85|nr:phycocyanin [Geitlerinema sp. PCC 7407]AFY65210.1 Phycocyanin [Geitlerinema sp. PCC 7407]